MAAVHKQDPAAVKELLAYMFTIIRAAQEFEDPETMTRHSMRRLQLLEIANGRKLTPLFTVESLPAMPRECQYLLPAVTSVRLITPHNHYRGIIQTHPRQNAQRQCHLPCLPLQGAISVISSTRAHAATFF